MQAQGIIKSDAGFMWENSAMRSNSARLRCRALFFVSIASRSIGAGSSDPVKRNICQGLRSRNRALDPIWQPASGDHQMTCDAYVAERRRTQRDN